MIFIQNKIMVDFSMQNDSQSDIVITQPNLKATSNQSALRSKWRLGHSGLKL